MTTVQIPRHSMLGSDEARLSRPVSRLRAVVLLAGVLRQTPFHAGLQRSLLDLPIDSSVSIMGHWLEHVSNLAQAAGVSQLPLRILLDLNSPEPTVRIPAPRVNVQIERDSLRGTGGVLRDVATAYDDDDFLLVANGAQLLLDNLVDLTGTLAAAEAGVALLSLPDKTPAGMMLIRCGALREIAEIGFVDMNEQALPSIARRHHVAVVSAAVDRHRVRTMPDYLHALACRYRRLDSGAAARDAFAEEWRSTFAIAEEGATVGRVSVLHDSVVLRQARVDDGVVLVRSVICPGAFVASGRTIVDQLVV